MDGFQFDYLLIVISAAAVAGAGVAVLACRRIYGARIGTLTRQLARSEAARTTAEGLLVQAQQQATNLHEHLKQALEPSHRAAAAQQRSPAPSDWIELPEVVDHSLVDFEDTERSNKV